MAVILLVDDNGPYREALGAALAEAGYAVLEVDDGYRALDTIARRRVDAIVTDYRMPRPNGVQLLRMLRSQGLAIPSVLITAFPIPVPHPADVLLHKPFPIRALLDELDRLLERSTQAAAQTGG